MYIPKHSSTYQPWYFNCQRWADRSVYWALVIIKVQFWKTQYPKEHRIPKFCVKEQYCVHAQTN